MLLLVLLHLLLLVLTGKAVCLGMVVIVCPCSAWLLLLGVDAPARLSAAAGRVL
jgi:hypothetical protein